MKRLDLARITSPASVCEYHRSCRGLCSWVCLVLDQHLCHTDSCMMQIFYLRYILFSSKQNNAYRWINSMTVKNENNKNISLTTQVVCNRIVLPKKLHSKLFHDCSVTLNSKICRLIDCAGNVSSKITEKETSTFKIKSNVEMTWNIFWYGG